MTKQLTLIPLPKPGRTRLFKRRGSRFWQCRVWARGQWHQRSCNTEHRGAAQLAAALWKLQLERRGRPRRVLANLDAL